MKATKPTNKISASAIPAITPCISWIDDFIDVLFIPISTEPKNCSSTFISALVTRIPFASISNSVVDTLFLLVLPAWANKLPCASLITAKAIPSCCMISWTKVSRDAIS